MAAKSWKKDLEDNEIYYKFKYINLMQIAGSNQTKTRAHQDG